MISLFQSNLFQLKGLFNYISSQLTHIKRCHQRIKNYQSLNVTTRNVF